MGKSSRAGDTKRPLRVMQSFGAPRATTNPYIHMLDKALAETAGMEHLRFDRRRALLGRYEVLHLHWPESLMGGSTPLKAVLRRLYFEALLVRVRISRIAVVRTAHNVDLPDVGRWERRMLRAVERRTTLRIVLNGHTGVVGESVLIPHGHYRDWFGVPRRDPDPQLLGFVGLIRRYKGVEALIDAFAGTAAEAADLRLRIAGNPTSAQLGGDVAALAAGDPRIDVDLRYLSEDDFANAILDAGGVVLPYRFMHNSGSVLAALSLDRPVLVPRNAVNEALAEEVGTEWITMFDGDLAPDDLIAFHRSLSTRPPDPPRLTKRDWATVGEQHRAAFARAREVRSQRSHRSESPGG